MTSSASPSSAWLLENKIKIKDSQHLFNMNIHNSLINTKQRAEKKCFTNGWKVDKKKKTITVKLNEITLPPVLIMAGAEHPPRSLEVHAATRTSYSVHSLSPIISWLMTSLPGTSFSLKSVSSPHLLYNTKKLSTIKLDTSTGICNRRKIEWNNN